MARWDEATLISGYGLVTMPTVTGQAWHTRGRSECKVGCFTNVCFLFISPFFLDMWRVYVVEESPQLVFSQTVQYSKMTGQAWHTRGRREFKETFSSEQYFCALWFRTRIGKWCFHPRYNEARDELHYVAEGPVAEGRKWQKDTKYEIVKRRHQLQICWSGYQ